MLHPSQHYVQSKDSLVIESKKTKTTIFTVNCGDWILMDMWLECTFRNVPSSSCILFINIKT